MLAKCFWLKFVKFVFLESFAIHFYNWIIINLMLLLILFFLSVTNAVGSRLELA